MCSVKIVFAISNDLRLRRLKVVFKGSRVGVSRWDKTVDEMRRVGTDCGSKHLAEGTRC